jgi:hypothetical protein
MAGFGSRASVHNIQTTTSIPSSMFNLESQLHLVTINARSIMKKQVLYHCAQSLSITSLFLQQVPYVLSQ